MTKTELAAFSKELEKIAFPGGAILRRGARWLTDRGALRGALAGGSIGGIGNAAKAYSQGEDSQGVLRAGITGAAGGATLGAVGGGVGRKFRDVRLLDPSLSAGAAAKATAGSMGTGIKNFGKRQLHGVTGAYKNQAAEIGLGGTQAAKKQVALEHLRRADRLKGVTNQNQIRKIKKYTKEQVGDITETGARQQAALDAGITSLRGVGSGLVRNPRETAKAMWRANAGKGLSGKAMTVGIPAAISVPELMKGDESAAGGKSLAQKTLNAGAMVGGSLAFGAMPIVANMTGWDLATRASDLPFYRKKRAPGMPANISARAQYT